MPRLAFASLAFVLTLALSACAGPIPHAVDAAAPSAVDANTPPVPAFTFAPRPASEPLPTHSHSREKLEMDWLS